MLYYEKQSPFIDSYVSIHYAAPNTAATRRSLSIWPAPNGSTLIVHRLAPTFLYPKPNRIVPLLNSSLVYNQYGRTGWYKLYINGGIIKDCCWKGFCMDFICVELCMDFVWFLDLFMGVEERIETEAICDHHRGRKSRHILLLSLWGLLDGWSERKWTHYSNLIISTRRLDWLNWNLRFYQDINE